ncbi:hypothetical protein [Shewanella gaetbuli]
MEDKLVGLLSALQAANHELTIGSGHIIFKDLVTKNDPDVSASALSSVYNIQSFILAYRGMTKYNVRKNISRQKRTAQRYAEMANMVNDSRDKMTANRSYRVFGKIRLPFLAFWADKKGGTDYIMMKKNNRYMWNWTSLDTFSLWMAAQKGFKTRKYEIPLGWGAAHALNEKLDTEQFNYQGRKKVTDQQFSSNNWQEMDYKRTNKLKAWGGAWGNGTAAGLVKVPTYWQNERKGDDYNNLNTVNGIRKFIDFKNDRKTSLGPSFSVLLAKGQDKLRTLHTINNASGGDTRNQTIVIEQQGSILDNKLYAFASAQSYFSRPNETLARRKHKSWMIQWGRKDRLKEYGNLYNPFWQTRLQTDDDNILKLLINAAAG